jgi:hypothetical protein
MKCNYQQTYTYSNVRVTQVEKYGLVPAEKHRKSMERRTSIPTGNFSDFFRWFPIGSCQRAQKIDWNPLEKIRNFSGQNTTSTSSYFRCFPAGPGDFCASFLQDPVAVTFDPSSTTQAVTQNGQNKNRERMSYYTVHISNIYIELCSSYRDLCCTLILLKIMIEKVCRVVFIFIVVQ